MDDEGTVFTTDGTPTIIANVQDVLSLEHMGLSGSQVIGIIGELCMSGSNLNGGYTDTNNYNGGGTLDHNAADHDPSHWPVDPISAEEAAYTMGSSIGDPHGSPPAFMRRVCTCQKACIATDTLVAHTRYVIHTGEAQKPRSCAVENL